MGNVIMGAVPGSKSTSKLISSGVSLACSECWGEGRGEEVMMGEGGGEERKGVERGKRW